MADQHQDDPIQAYKARLAMYQDQLTPEEYEQFTTSVVAVSGIIGYSFEDPTLLWQALHRQGQPVKQLGSRSNMVMHKSDMLAVLGLVAIKGVILHHAYRDESTDSDDMEDIAREFASTEALSRAAGRLGLIRYMNWENEPADPSVNILSKEARSHLVCAIVGAVNRDNGKENKEDIPLTVVTGMGLCHRASGIASIDLHQS